MAAPSTVSALNDHIDFSKLSIADSGSSETDQGDIGATSPLSPKLRDKLDKLAKWRIDPSLIEFQEGARKFEGGHAIVSQALLTPASAAETKPNKATNADGGHESGGEKLKRKAIAVKRLKIEGKEDRERVLGLALREAGFLIGMSHGHVIRLEGFVEDLANERIWLIFPWHEPGNLKDFVASQDWEIPERICLIWDVTGGVKYLHSRDPPIMHGDLKSINVLVTSNCRAVITDFGSARRLTKKEADAETSRTKAKVQPAADFQATFCATSNTMTFTVNEYTLRWAAPELLMDDEPTLASDIWALGWICYEVMTNSIPFENVNKDSMVIKNVMGGNLPCVTNHVRMSLILRLSSLMISCWSVDPTKRPTSEECCNLIAFMPMTIPAPERSTDSVLSRARSPELLMKLGDMHKDQNDYINASKLYSEALAIYKKTCNNAGRANALFGLGDGHAGQAEWSKATTFYSEACQIRTSIGDRQGRADAMWGLAQMHAYQEEYSGAITLYSEVIQISLDIGDETRRASALRGLADVHLYQGDYDQAMTSYSEAVEIFTQKRNMLGRSAALNGLAEVKRRQTKYSEAISLFSESLKLSTDIGDRFGRAYALLGLARIHRDQDRPLDAVYHCEEAAEIFEQIGYTHNAAIASRAAADLRRRIKGLGAQ